MKAILLNQNNILTLGDLDTPEPAAGQVRIKIIAAGFNPIDYQMRENEFERRHLHSPVLGRELSGIVDSLGPDVHQLHIGDEVFCTAGNMGSNGTYAEYIVVPEGIVVLKPKNISFEQAAGIPSAGITALQCFNRMGVNPDARIFITGAAGGVGNLLIRLLKVHHYDRFVVTAGSDDSIQSLKDIGVDDSQILNYKKEDIVQAAVAKNDGQHFDIAVDCVGNNLAEVSGAVLKKNGVYMDVTNFHTSGSREILFNKGATVHHISNFIYAAEKDYSYFRNSLEYLKKMIEDETLMAPVVNNIGSLNAETVERAHYSLKNNLTRGKKLVMSII